MPETRAHARRAAPMSLFSAPSPAPPPPPAGRNAPAPLTLSFRERLGALRNLPPLFRLVWQTSAALTLANVGLRLVWSLLPVAMLYVAKLTIDEVVRLAGSGLAPSTIGAFWADGTLDTLALLLAAEFGLAVASDALGRAGCQQELIAAVPSLGIRAWRVSGDLARWSDLISAGVRERWLVTP